jgi:mono/diheme cytochrome c family protein
MDDFKKLLFSVLIAFAALIVIFVSFTFIWSCGLDFSCQQVSLLPAGTPIPTLIPATLPAPLTFAPISTPTIVTADAGTPTADASSAIARPSNPGGPGDAVNLTGYASEGAQLFATNCVPCHAVQGVGGNPNPGSTDGTIPTLNPIDPTLKDPDYKIFAFNLDLFLQHGSTPAGPAPTFSMPAWGDLGALTQQQIADVIAYLISLNP